jgi:A/G-specific adenine glycosylase
MNAANFQALVLDKGEELYREMPWRVNTDPYFVLVSELMLQQTQVARVVPKFEAFIEAFPTLSALADAPLSEVLRMWSGLGYNRRAKFLHEAAKRVVSEYSEVLPGIGTATAGAIAAYAYNQPVVFIETNVRTVYFHHFFKSESKISDTQLIPLIEATIYSENPRKFYWALMDYGSWLKQNVVKNTNGKNKHYKKQSVFHGSVRQMRGQIIRILAMNDQSLDNLQLMFKSDERFLPALERLQKDGLITERNGVYSLTKS